MCYRVLQGVTECYRVLQGVTGRYLVLQGVTSCDMVVHGLKSSFEYSFHRTNLPSKYIYQLSLDTLSIIISRKTFADDY